MTAQVHLGFRRKPPEIITVVGRIQKRGFRKVHLAGNGAAAVDLAVRRQPDVILMDPSLSAMDRWHAVKRLNTEPGTSRIPVLTLVSDASSPAGLHRMAYTEWGDPANPRVTANTCPSQRTLIPAGGTFSCSFDAFLTGEPGDPDHVDTVSVTVADDEGNEAADSDRATVSFGDAVPAVDVSKGAAPGSVRETGETATFSVEVANLSVEPVTLVSLQITAAQGAVEIAWSAPSKVGRVVDAENVPSALAGVMLMARPASAACS